MNSQKSYLVSRKREAGFSATFAKGEELLYQNPFSESLLTDLGISRDFIGYLRKMPVASLNVVK